MSLPNMSIDDEPSAWVVRFASSIVDGGTVLDVACGNGRHACWFEARGHRVTGIDRDAAALAISGASEALLADLEGAAWPLSGRTFDAVVVANYLHRPLFPILIASLAPRGVLIYETFASGNERFGRPTNPAFLLTPGELLAKCEGLQIVAYEDGVVAGPRPASRQRICAVRALAEAPPTWPRHAL